MIKAYELEGFVEGNHQPYTDYNQEIIDWLHENNDWGYLLDKAKYIFTQKAYYDFSFYTANVVFEGDVYYTNDEFKEWIGMTNKQYNKMPELIAGRHFVKFENGQYAMVMDGYINYVTLGEYNTDLRITDFDHITLLGRSPYHVIEVYDPVKECSKHFNLPDFASGEFTVWKKQDQRTLNIKKELESCEAKMERLQAHMTVLRSKLNE